MLAGYIALGQASDSLRMILNSRMSSTGIQNVSSRLATCSSQEIASGDYARSSRAAHEAVTGGRPGVSSFHYGCSDIHHFFDGSP